MYSGCVPLQRNDSLSNTTYSNTELSEFAARKYKECDAFGPCYETIVFETDHRERGRRGCTRTKF